MSRAGRARILTDEEFEHVLRELSKHRHEEKNTALIQICFKLGLKAQELAMLCVRDVALVANDVGPGIPFLIKRNVTLPMNFTKQETPKQIRAVKSYSRKTLRFSRHDFDQAVAAIVERARREPNETIDPTDFYPNVRSTKRAPRQLPLSDCDLRKALHDYLSVRYLEQDGLRPYAPLFMSQKGGPYTSQGLAEHLSLILSQWAALKGSSSHSGPRTFATRKLNQEKLRV